jgi:predicted nucleic acid-binding protein
VSPVVVDTSVWRRYFGGSPSVRRLGRLLDEDEVRAHPWVIAELVLGGLSVREEGLLSRLPAVAVVPHGDVLELVRREKLARRGIGWVDVNLLASTRVASATLWTLDRDLDALAAKLGVQFSALAP